MMSKISDLKFDDKNFNKHTEFGMGLLEKSLKQFGAGRSILIDKDNNIIAGNGIVEAAGQAGLEKVKIIETTGEEIVAVKRTDVSLNSTQGREMALADNATAAVDLSWNKENLTECFDDDTLKGFGINLNFEEQTEYQYFVDKFKPKLTTDDCYTPKPVFEAVEKWVREHYNLGDIENIRPFKPNGDYKAENYDGKVVIDNPPFSILSEIVRWFSERGVRFFLFAPYLTTFSITQECRTTRVITGGEITYENGAKVLTNFITNMDEADILVEIAGSLRLAIEAAQPNESAELEKYIRPKNLKVGTDFVYAAKNGTDWKMTNKEVELTKQSDYLKTAKKGLFGGGLFVSDKIAEKAAAEKAAAEKAAAEKAAIKVELSEREQKIVDRLNRKES